ncbi:hypothetical protein PUN28_011647 [Cardiocondyla obscurior]|uniref:Uncharacterized protein n=1 Tax=Cardiocondyla obscurior TaxID=286306 RepID=A0AAW2FKG7_9HYME
MLISYFRDRRSLRGFDKTAFLLIPITTRAVPQQRGSLYFQGVQSYLLSIQTGDTPPKRFAFTIEDVVFTGSTLQVSPENERERETRSNELCMKASIRGLSEHSP